MRVEGLPTVPLDIRRRRKVDNEMKTGDADLKENAGNDSGK